MRLVFFITLLAPIFCANASGWYTTEKIDVKASKYGSIQVTYPQFAQELGSAQASINAQLKTAAEAMHCDSDTGDAANMDYEGDIVVKTITKDFVSMVATEGYDCGGPHPDGFTETFVFDRKTGKRVQMEVEFGGLAPNDKFDDAKYEAYTKKIAELLAPHVPKDTIDCLKDGGPSDVDMKQELQDWSFAIGLRRGAVSFYANPAHVIAACGFDVTLPYAEVAAALEKNSIVHSWMK